MQEAGGAAGERAGEPVAVRDAAQGLAPGAGEVGVLEQRERAVDAVDELGELRARLLVEADARARQADRAAQDDPAQHRGDALVSLPRTSP